MTTEDGHYDGWAETVHEMKWHVGSEHKADDTGILDIPEYRYDTKGWPFFIGINRKETGKSDFHIATGIQSLQTAKRIARLHNDTLPRQGLFRVQANKPGLE